MPRTIALNDGARTLRDLTLYGLDGLRIRDPGELMTDLYGLDTCTTVWEAPSDLVPASWPQMFSAHPIYTWTNLERRRVQIGEGLMTITGDYAGVNGTSASIFELCLGVADEPIVTHPKFTTDIGGTPSNPLHGAVFLDPNGNITTDDSVGQFAYFNHTTEFAGIESYLAADQMTWRERYVSRAEPSATDVGFISNPHYGVYGSPPSTINWIQISCTFEQRGVCFFVTNEWRAGGRRGWNTTIYNH